MVETWEGDEAVSAEDAHGLVDGHLARDHDHSMATAQWQAELTDWIKQQSEVRREAWQQAFTAAQQRALPHRAATEAANQAARTAVQQFEREHPKPEFEQPPSQSWFGRLRKGL